MRYFTNNPLERLMMQKPKAARGDSPPDAAKERQITITSATRKK